LYIKIFKTVLVSFKAHSQNLGGVDCTFCSGWWVTASEQVYRTMNFVGLNHCESTEFFRDFRVFCGSRFVKYGRCKLLFQTF